MSHGELSGRPEVSDPIIGLHLLRWLAVAALMIHTLAFASYGQAFGLPDIAPRIDELPMLLQLLAESGWVGVEVLFVLAGMSVSYATDRGMPAGFLRGRAWRLWPTMLICACLLAVLVLAVHRQDAGMVFRAWLGTIAFLPDGPWLAPHFWMLSVELIFFLAVWIVLRNRPSIYLSVLAWGLALVCIAYWTPQSIAYVGSSNVLGNISPSTNDFVSRMLLLQHGCYFALGIALARLDHEDFALDAFALIAVAGCAAWWQLGAGDLFTGSVQAAFQHNATNGGPLLFLMAVLGIVVAFLRKDQIWLVAGRAAGAFGFLCRSAYPLLLIHVHVGGIVMMATTEWPALMSLATACLVSIGLSMLVTALVDQIPRRRAAPHAALRARSQDIARYA